MRPPAPAGANLVLIGMPGVGKSTIGVLLAKRLNKDFVDTDVYIQRREQRRLQDIIDEDGLAAFRRLEERYLLSLDCSDHVIATGGSAVYSASAMEHLKRNGVVIHLWLPLPELERRIPDLETRGVVMEPNQSFAGLYAERQPLYERHGEIRLDVSGLDHERVVERAIHALAGRV